MAAILRSIRHNLAHVARFSGRDTPGQFWPYAIFLFLLSMLAGLLLWVPVLTDMLARAQAYLAEHPEGFSVTPDSSGAPMLPPELMPDMSMILVPMALVNGLFVLLLAAAIVRRLHDRDHSGWWALLPLPFMIYGQVQANDAAAWMTGGAAADPAAMLPAALNSLLYWIAVIALIVILVQAGTNGANRFGAEPGRGA